MITRILTLLAVLLVAASAQASERSATEIVRAAVDHWRGLSSEAVMTMVITVPMSVLAAKFYKSTRLKVFTVFLLLAPLFVSSDILGSSLLVFFKNLNAMFGVIGDSLGVAWFDNWFELGFLTALIGLIIYTLPYAFIVVLITMGRYHEQQTEAARACGASGWRWSSTWWAPHSRTQSWVSGREAVATTFRSVKARNSWMVMEPTLYSSCTSPAAAPRGNPRASASSAAKTKQRAIEAGRISPLHQQPEQALPSGIWRGSRSSGSATPLESSTASRRGSRVPTWP